MPLVVQKCQFAFAGLFLLLHKKNTTVPVLPHDLLTFCQGVVNLLRQTKGKNSTIQLLIQLEQSPAFLTSYDFIRSNEIIRTKWQIYVVIGHFVLMI